MTQDQPALHTCPFAIAIDTAEQQPFDFSRIRYDANAYWKIHTPRIALGRHPEGYGDYSICGYEKQVAVERKAQSDSYSTIMGFKEGNRDRFEDELANLSEIVACVIVECSFERWLKEAPETPQKTAEENRKTLFRSYVGLMQDYGVPWIFAETKSLAAICCFNFLNRFWEKVRKGEQDRGNHIRGGRNRGDASSVRGKRWRRAGSGSVGGGSSAGGVVAGVPFGGDAAPQSGIHGSTVGSTLSPRTTGKTEPRRDDPAAAFLFGSDRDDDRDLPF